MRRQDPHSHRGHLETSQLTSYLVVKSSKLPLKTQGPHSPLLPNVVLKSQPRWRWGFDLLTVGLGSLLRRVSVWAKERSVSILRSRRALRQTHFSPFTASGRNRMWSCVKISCVRFLLIWYTKCYLLKEKDEPCVHREMTASTDNCRGRVL